MSEEEFKPIENYHRSWEDETTFNDVLADTLSKAPYLLVSLGIHLLIAVLVAGLAFLRAQETIAPTIEMTAEPPPPDVEEEEEDNTKPKNGLGNKNNRQMGTRQPDRTQPGQIHGENHNT